MPATRASRPRAPYLALLVATIATGLATRWYPAVFPRFVATYAGDALWAMMVFWALCLVRRDAATRRLALAALAVSFAVEVSQLVRAPWLDALRSSRLGALVLGQGFLWSDLACYSVGIALAAATDHAMRRTTVT